MTTRSIRRERERYISSLGATRKLFAPIADEPREFAVFAYLDPEWRLLGMRHIPAGTADSAEIPIREIAADAIAFGAAAVVMAHNHPSGDATPSDADIAFTRRLARALDALGVRLDDHIILAGPSSTSLRALGLL